MSNGSMEHAQPDGCVADTTDQLKLHSISNLEERLQGLHGKVEPWLGINDIPLHQHYA